MAVVQKQLKEQQQPPPPPKPSNYKGFVGGIFSGMAKLAGKSSSSSCSP